MTSRSLTAFTGIRRILWLGIALCACMAQAEVKVTTEHLTDAAGNALGRYRHLLFDISGTANRAE